MSSLMPGPPAAAPLPGPAPGAPIRWQTARVLSIHDETSRAKTFRLQLPHRTRHMAGQYFVLRLTAPDGYTASRAYSLSSPPEGADGSTVIDLTVELLDDGEVSTYLHEVVQPGDELDVRGPIGGFFAWDGDHACPARRGWLGHLPADGDAAAGPQHRPSGPGAPARVGAHARVICTSPTSSPVPRRPSSTPARPRRATRAASAAWRRPTSPRWCAAGRRCSCADRRGSPTPPRPRCSPPGYRPGSSAWSVSDRRGRRHGRGTSRTRSGEIAGRHATARVRSAKLKIPRMDLPSPSIREYRMECTGDTHRTVRTAVTRSLTRTATRTVAVVAAGAALVAGGVAAARTVPRERAGGDPDRPDLGPGRAAGQHRRVEPGLVTHPRPTGSAARRPGAGRSPLQPG